MTVEEGGRHIRRDNGWPYRAAVAEAEDVLSA